MNIPEFKDIEDVQKFLRYGDRAMWWPRRGFRAGVIAIS